MEYRNSIIAATSPQTEDSYNHHLITLINPLTGKNVYNVVYLYEVCQACLDAGKAHKCTHNQEQLSDSKRQETVDEVRLGYRAGQSAAKLRETAGVTTSGVDRLIPADYITRFFNTRVKVKSPSLTLQIDGKPRCLYLAIDPSGGGDSELGIVGIVESYTQTDLAKLVVSLFLNCFVH